MNNQKRYFKTNEYIKYKFEGETENLYLKLRTNNQNKLKNSIFRQAIINYRP